MVDRFSVVSQSPLPLTGDLADNLPKSSSPKLTKPFDEPERELHKRINEARVKAVNLDPRNLFEEMADDQLMWNARRASPAIPLQPITKP
ncbi:hypothetical protein OSB04_023943 [Centaurea solstitialis]|uniref:Uncharacterized protein n=1 Tax=Centaurea solstitialis TaxID=347529 RepID=A0AA38WDE4_9ASTR|nr:hypothetical protein OSB04_023943 [Centaurea solstitialis]